MNHIKSVAACTAATLLLPLGGQQLHAQSNITPEVLKTLESAQTHTPSDHALCNAVSSNSINKFNSHLKRKLREYGILLREKAEKGAGVKQLEAEKVEMMKTVYLFIDDRFDFALSFMQS